MVGETKVTIKYCDSKYNVELWIAGEKSPNERKFNTKPEALSEAKRMIEGMLLYPVIRVTVEDCNVGDCVWFKITCDKCGAENWLYDGNPNDETRPDIKGFICYKCNESHSFADEMELEMGVGDDPDSFELGKEKPE